MLLICQSYEWFRVEAGILRLFPLSKFDIDAGRWLWNIKVR